MALSVHAAPSFPVPRPNRTEEAALRCAGDYLARAGTSAASILLGAGTSVDPDLLVDLCDGLLAAAAICAGVIDLLEPPDA